MRGLSFLGAILLWIVGNIVRYDHGLGWALPAIVGGAVLFAYAIKGKRPARTSDDEL